MNSCSEQQPAGGEIIMSRLHGVYYAKLVQEAVAPGKTGFIQASYNPKGRRDIQ